MQKRNRKELKKKVLKYLNENSIATSSEIGKKFRWHFYFAETLLTELCCENLVKKIETKNLTIYEKCK